jgi:hypothetical protein
MITALFQWYILISTNQRCPHDQQTWTFFDLPGRDLFCKVGTGVSMIYINTRFLQAQ